MYGLYGLEHHIVEISGDVTDAGRANERRTREDRATHYSANGCWMAEVRKTSDLVENGFPKWVYVGNFCQPSV